MSRKTQYQIGQKQKLLRKKTRKKLIAQGKNPADYYYGRFSVKTK